MVSCHAAAVGLPILFSYRIEYEFCAEDKIRHDAATAALAVGIFRADFRGADGLSTCEKALFTREILDDAGDISPIRLFRYSAHSRLL